MKNTMKLLALVLAIGATAQTIRAYAQVSASINAEEEAYQISRLMQLKSQMDAREMNLVSKGDIEAISSEFPNIKTEEDFKEEFVIHTLRYIQAIKAEETFHKVKKRIEFNAAFDHDSPGV